jgi:hypothetical protein
VYPGKNPRFKFRVEFPINDDKSQIYELVSKGIPLATYNKHLILKPHIYPEYGYGCHFANPKSTGIIKSSDSSVEHNVEKAHLKLFHYTIFGESFIENSLKRMDRLCEWNILNGMGVYKLDGDYIFNPKNEYENTKNNCKEVVK